MGITEGSLRWKRCYCLRKVGFSVKMKVLCAVAVVLVLGLQESSGMSLGALPPTYVRSAVFANNLGSAITIEVTLESQKTETHAVQAGESEKVVPVSSPFGIQRHRYEVGVGAANGLEITKTT